MNRKETFSRQVLECQNTMYAVAYSILKNDQDAADAIGEAILRAYTHLDSLKNSKAFKPWILRIVHNASIDALQKRCDAVDIDTQELADEGSNDDVPAKIALREAVENLRQPYRTVVTLYYYETLPIAQIAQITGQSTRAVKTQLGRAREMLRNTLSKEDFF